MTSMSRRARGTGTSGGSRGAGVTVRTPAKVNLCLAVGPPRADGFHPLATVYQAVSLFDEVTAAPAPDGEVTLEIAGVPAPDHRRRRRPGDGDVGDPSRGSGLEQAPTDDRNLAVRAARLLAERAGTPAGVRLRLRKEIPVAGGMAGGSADAAAALVACNALWRTGLSVPDLQRLAGGLGSDVPFCVAGGTAVGSGRGERVEPLHAPGTYHWVLAVAHGGLSTPAVYAEVDRLRGDADVPEPVVPAGLTEALHAGDAEALGRALSNDLQEAALSLRPGLADLLARGRSGGALGAVVSGSGPTCVFLAGDRAHALEIGAEIAGACRAVHHVTGPVPGPQAVGP